ncbi:hypothetical protein BJ742DRAFT_849731 [Cladochytrium replicatum]|nr:hypothetical protein BJ742DRAFT_849731 [Cladochytrium replicatum]
MLTAYGYSTLAICATAAAAAAAFGVFFVLHMLWLENWTDWLYYEKKILKRRIPLGKVDKNERNILENFGDLATLTYTPLLFLAPHLLHAVQTNTLDLSVKPIPIILGTILIYICFDLFYYFVHRALHEVPFLYRNIHKRHHEEHPVHVYLTGHAEYIENILAASPGLTLWVLATNALTLSNGRPLNLWNYVLPAVTLIMEFNTAHSGYLDHPLLYFTSPLQYFVKMLPITRKVSLEHEVHHLSMKKNYAPVFWVFDRIFGTDEPGNPDLFYTAEVIEPKFKPKFTAKAK